MTTIKLAKWNRLEHQWHTESVWGWRQFYWAKINIIKKSLLLSATAWSSDFFRMSSDWCGSSGCERIQFSNWEDHNAAGILPPAAGAAALAVAAGEQVAAAIKATIRKKIEKNFMIYQDLRFNLNWFAVEAFRLLYANNFRFAAWKFLVTDNFTSRTIESFCESFVE